ncbi:flagellar assembly protein FliH [Aneurinibacillus thermoaerophilus]|uniref:Flagellar assembly protein FliH n=1 Tax=Aneurinibacillus thermoaerophilus TaxID=143495 RepID=A0A1G7WE63_ANETH|nr:flagellar assembly protein FliH [Aneurinibacillus thermoaerophilus]
MRLLSRVIKSSFYLTAENKKVIELPYRKENKPHHDSAVTIQEYSTPQGDEIVREAEAKATCIIKEAKQQAKELIEEARRDIDAWWAAKRQEDEEIRTHIQQEGFAQGIELGKEEGRRLIYEEYAEMLRRAAAILEEAPAVKRKMIAEAEPFVLNLTLAIARKVIGEHLEMDKDNVLALIHKALSHTKEYKSMVVAVSPDVYPYVQENRAKLLEVLDSQVEVTIVPDGSISDGGAVIRTTMGSVDARVDTQLEEIKKALLETIGNESES